MKIKDIHDPYCVLNAPLWKYDGNSFMEKSAYGNILSVTGAVWGSQGRTFDGTDDLITTISNTGISGAAPRSLEVWAKSNKTDYSVNQGWIVDFGGWGDDTVFGIIANTGGTWGLHYGPAVANTTVVVDLLWHHFVAIYNGTLTYVYIDNVITAVNGTPLTLNTANTPVALGYCLPAAARWFQGVIGECRLYSRALTLGEIQNNYLSTKWRYT